MLVFTDDITRINNLPIARVVSQHSGFCLRVRQPGALGAPDIWLCEAGYILPGIPGTPFLNGGQIQARGLLDFSGNVPEIVAITGGTGDYLRASGQAVLVENPPITDFTLTIETP
jgi:hypothetical protein